MLGLESVKVEVVIAIPPEVRNGDYPAGVHRLDIGAFASDMAVFRGIVVSNDEVRNIWSEVILMCSSELSDTLSDDSLEVGLAGERRWLLMTSVGDVHDPRLGCWCSRRLCP